MALKTLLSHKPFFFYFWARSFSEFAYQMAAVAVGWQVYSLTSSAFDLGMVGLVQFIPTAVLVFAAGHAADRYDRKRVVQICQIVEGLTATFLAWASFSGHLNVREICPSCRRAHLSAEGLLHHFACGYVGIPSEFSPTDDGSYLCPKCNRKMHHLGTEFDRLGKAFSCRGCGVISENPPVEAVCLTCGARNRAEDLISTLVFSYVLTSRGAAAIRRGSLFDGGEEDIVVVGAPVYRRGVILEFLDNEMRRLQRFKDVFSVLSVKCAPAALGPDGNQAPTEWLSRLREKLRDVDLIGQVGDALYIVILPQTKRREAESLCDRIEVALGRESPLTLSIAEITEPRDLAQALPGLAARAEP